MCKTVNISTDTVSINNMIQSIANIQDPQLERMVHKLIDFVRENNLDNWDSSYFESHPTLISEELIDLGKIQGPYLYWSWDPYSIRINLRAAIHTSLNAHEPNYQLIKLLLTKSIDIFLIEPRLITICIDNNCDDLAVSLANIGHLYPTQIECLYNLATKGKVNILHAYLSDCKLPRNIFVHQLAHKLCALAIQSNQLPILEFLLPPSVFPNMPDTIFDYLIASIRNDASIDIIKYFVENGQSLRQSDYLAVRIAKEKNRSDLLKYFVQKDSQTQQIIKYK